MVPDRLAKNAKLHRQLASRSSEFWVRTDAGLIVRSMSLPFDTAKLMAYFAYAVRGLLWHHLSLYLPEDSFVTPMCLSDAGAGVINRLLSLNARAYISKNLGNGTVEYRGSQGLDRPEVTVWQFRLYGGIALAGDPQAPDDRTTSVGVFTGPRRAALKAQWRAGTGGLRLEALIPPPVYPGARLPLIGALNPLPI